jgi:hypothetical protein
MNIKHEQFIGIYEDAFSKEYCDTAIQYFEDMVATGHGISRQILDKTSKKNKEDTAVFVDQFKLTGVNNLLLNFNNTFWNTCYTDYADKYWGLQTVEHHNSYFYKVQKTEIGQGYHAWHCESDSKVSCARLLAWSLYLNDVTEGGETEFLNQHLRIKPKTGTLVIWPAGFTHIHRGNPPISENKYIATGWVEF